MKNTIYKLKLLWWDLTYNKLVFITSFILILCVNLIFVFSNTCIDGFSKSVNIVENKLGADIVVVSNKFDSEMQHTLFLGNPSTIEFDGTKAINVLRSMDGIERYTTQLFMSSLNDSCCEQQLQFIVYDEDSDFLITPWVEELHRQSNKRDIIVGNNIDYEIGDKPVFFDCVFCVAGKLQKTGMGYDNCIFVNKTVAESISNFLELDQDENGMSLLCINVKDDVEIKLILDKLNEELKDSNLVAYRSNELYSDISSNISKIDKGVNIFLFMIYLLCGFSLFAIISLGNDGRKTDIVLLRLLGVKNKTEAMIIIIENFMLSIIASAVGIIVSILTIILSKEYLEYALSISLSLDSQVIRTAVISLLISLLISCIVSIYSVYKVYKTKT